MIDPNGEISTTPPQSEFMTPEEIARATQWPLSHILRRLRSGDLPGVSGGTRAGWRVRRTDFQEWWDRQIREWREEQQRKRNLERSN